MDSAVSDMLLTTRRLISLLTASAVMLTATLDAIAQTQSQTGQTQPQTGDTDSQPIAVSEQAAPSIIDVRLSADGTAAMSIMDSAGHFVSGANVVVAYQGHEIAQAVSDASGQFTITGLRPGLHSLMSLNSGQMYRFWASDEAPPSALEKGALVVQTPAARGQYGPMMGYPMQPMMGPSMMAPGLLATTITAAAVAVVLIGKSKGSDAVVIPASP